MLPMTRYVICVIIFIALISFLIKSVVSISCQQNDCVNLISMLIASGEGAIRCQLHRVRMDTLRYSRYLLYPPWYVGTINMMRFGCWRYISGWWWSITPGSGGRCSHSGMCGALLTIPMKGVAIKTWEVPTFVGLRSGLIRGLFPATPGCEMERGDSFRVNFNAAGYF